MQDILDIIKSRRSVRKYNDQAVPKEFIDKILEAGRWAPSAINVQPCRFVVVQDKEIKKSFGDAARFYFLINNHVADAGVIIAVCAKDKNWKWASLDCATASQNIMLEAHSLGLGSCFVGEFKEEKVKEALGLPDKMKVFGLITIGFQDGEVGIPPRLDISEIVFYDKYEEKESVGKKVLSPKSGTLSVLGKILRRK